jgi:hypothetical protein
VISSRYQIEAEFGSWGRKSVSAHPSLAISRWRSGKLLEKRRIYETEIRGLEANEVASFSRDVSPRAFDFSLHPTGVGWRGWRGESGAVSKDAGVTPINQGAAVAGGGTSCDTAGFPVTICTSGSYRLSGDLTVPVGVEGIEITASNVPLNLNGFTILLPATGSTPSICSIRAIGTLSLIRVQNGILSGGDCGVQLGSASNSLVSDVTIQTDVVTTSGATGITIGAISRVQDNRVTFPGVSCPLSAAVGIQASSNAVIRGNSVAAAQFGINVQCPAVVVENVLSEPFPGTSDESGFAILPDPFGGNSALYRSSCTFALNNQCTFSGSTPDQNCGLSGP